MTPIRFNSIKYMLQNKAPQSLTRPVLPILRDIFTRTKGVDLELKNILSKYAQMDLNDYTRLSEAEKKLLTTKANSFDGILIHKAKIDDAIAFSKTIVKSLDQKYGKDKYVFCSIGKSPALFANVLEAMGIESKICRYSNRYSHFFNVDNQQIYSKYKEYLTHIGLNPEIIKHSDKTYVFVDYVIEGRSLRSFQKIVENPIIGLKLNNVKFENMNQLIPRKLGINLNYQKYNTYMKGQTFKPYAIESIDKSIPFIKGIDSHLQNEPCEDEVKIFRFALFDKILGEGTTGRKH